MDHKEYDELQQVIENPPSWLVRYGTSLLLVIILLLLSITFYISYPDNFQSEVILTTSKPPVKVFSETNGKVNKLLVSNAEQVDSNTIVLIMESGASWRDIQQVKESILGLKNENSSKFSPIRNKTLKLGSLTSSYNLFINSFEQFAIAEQNLLYVKKTENLSKKLQELSNLDTTILDRKAILSRELELIKKDYERSKILYDAGHISDLTIEQMELGVLQSQIKLNDIQNSMINNRLTKIQTEQEISNLLLIQHNELDNAKIDLESALLILKEEIAIWERTYLKKSPCRGEISITYTKNNDQFITQGQELFAVIPKNHAYDSSFLAETWIPNNQVSKINERDDVRIRLNTFPHEEFGTILGRISEISTIPNSEGNYKVVISLPNGLTTDYEKQLTFIQELRGEVIFTTKSKSLFSRLFEQLINLLEY